MLILFIYYANYGYNGLTAILFQIVYYMIIISILTNVDRIYYLYISSCNTTILLTIFNMFNIFNML